VTSRIRWAAVLLAVTALLLNGSPAQAQAAWTTEASPNEPGRNFLYGADASDVGHVWAVGALVARDRITFRGLVLRHDGTAWRPAPLSGFPGNAGLFDVDAVSGNEAWAAGRSLSGIGRSNTLIARWNGSSWAPEPTPNGNPPGNSQLSGVAAAGGTVWAVGTTMDASYNRLALILQRTGGTWRVSSAPRVLGNVFLEGVDATGPSDAWAVGWGSADINSGPGGARPIALRWNGTSWRSQPPPAPAETTLQAVDALTPTNVWAAGRILSGWDYQPYVAQFNGTSWRRIATPTLFSGGELTDIVALSPSNIVAVGIGGSSGIPLVMHWNGSSWAVETASTPNATLTAAAAVGPNTFWAVGNRFELNAYEERTVTMVRT
jgi:hypothetical protein